MISINIIAVILWLIAGIFAIAEGAIHESKRPLMINYILAWTTLMIKLFFDAIN